DRTLSPLEPRNFTTVGPEYRNIAVAQEKDLKIAFMNMIEIIKWEMNKTAQELNVEIEFIKKTQTEVNLGT
ncbi:hypothetical protein ACQP3F_34175, partial [Escherichia coli]